MEKMLVSKFVENFKKVSNTESKQAMVKKHVVTRYSPILHKMNVLKTMMDGCVKQGKSGAYVDMAASKLNFIMAILILYTDLQVDRTSLEDKEVSDVWTAYDQLKESGALDMILNEIGGDIDELLSVQDQILSTWHNENASTAAYVSGLVEKVSMIFSTAVGQKMQPIVDIFNGISDEEKQNLFSLLKSE